MPNRTRADSRFVKARRLSSPMVQDTLCRYSSEQILFGQAMERYQRTTGRRYPTAREVFAVAWALGYRRVAAE